jgi:hypothetical protein
MRNRLGVILLVLAAGVAGCSKDDEEPGPLLPDVPGSRVLIQGHNNRLGPVDIGVKAVARGQASLSIVRKGDGPAGAPVDVVLAPGQSADVDGVRVTVIAVDDHSKRRRVRVTIEEPISTPTQPSVDTGPPPTPPGTLR